MPSSFARRAALVSSLVLAAGAPMSALGATRAGAPAAFKNWVVSNGANRVATGGEPTVGYDPKRDAVMYGAAGHETRMMFRDTKRGTTVQQTSVTAPTAKKTLDAITFTDKYTGRTFDDQLLGGCSAMSYSDDAGKTWMPTTGCGADVFLDHETVGGGPFHAPAPAHPTSTYPDAVYYCAQNGFNASCAVSLDGGLTFQPGHYISNTPTNALDDPDPQIKAEGGACSGLHGHIKIGADGTAYLPLKGCGGTPTSNNLTNSEYFGGGPAVSVSKDNGTTWTVHRVPGAHNQDESDNSVDLDKANRLYLAWEDGTNPGTSAFGVRSAAKVAFSDDEGTKWSKPVDLSTAVGVHNVQFPQVIAGDKGRAAVAFIGTHVIGDDQHVGFVDDRGNPAAWFLYVSMTYDGGKHWTTMNVTPGDPVQRGCVLMLGTSNKTATDDGLCDQRNLLDFNDTNVDRHGRVLVAWSDGCVATCVHQRSAKGKGAVDMLTRLSGGRGLVAKYDGRLGKVTAGSRGYRTSALFLLPLAATAVTRRDPRSSRRSR
jgi:hypothetical protein